MEIFVLPCMTYYAFTVCSCNGEYTEEFTDSKNKIIPWIRQTLLFSEAATASAWIMK